MLRYLLVLLALNSAKCFAPRSPLFHAQVTPLQAMNENESEQTFYDILGASPGDSPQQLRQHYHRLARKLHPDAKHSRQVPFYAKLNSDAVDSLDFSQVVAAWTILSNPKERLRYDRSLRVKKISNTVEGVVVMCFRLAFRVVSEVSSSARFFARQVKDEQRKQEVKTKRIHGPQMNGWHHLAMQRLIVFFVGSH